MTVKFFGTEASSADSPLVVYGDAASTPVIAGKKLIRDSSLTDTDRVDGVFKVRYLLSRSLDTIISADGKFRGHIQTTSGSVTSNNWQTCS